MPVQLASQMRTRCWEREAGQMNACSSDSMKTERHDTSLQRRQGRELCRVGSRTWEGRLGSECQLGVRAYDLRSTLLPQLSTLLTSCSRLPPPHLPCFVLLPPSVLLWPAFSCTLRSSSLLPFIPLPSSLLSLTLSLPTSQPFSVL